MWVMQDDLYKPNYYQSLMDFREQTLQRLQKYVDQRFFKTMDYLKGQFCPGICIHIKTQSTPCIFTTFECWCCYRKLLRGVPLLKAANVSCSTPATCPCHSMKTASCHCRQSS